MEGIGIPFDATSYTDIGKAILKIYSDPNFREHIISEERVLAGKYKSFSYFLQMRKIIDLFYNYHKTWKE